MKMKTTKWCLIICLIGGAAASSSAASGEGKRPVFLAKHPYSDAASIDKRGTAVNPKQLSAGEELEAGKQARSGGNAHLPIDSEGPVGNQPNTLEHMAVEVKGNQKQLNKQDSGTSTSVVPKPAPVPAKTVSPLSAVEEKTVYLTFDDGPHRVSEQILALLDEHGAKATFFMLDGNIRNFPGTVKKMAEKGHSLGAHGVSHDKDKIYQTPQTVVAEMNQTLTTIKQITGLDSSLIRTPYGSAPYMTAPYRKAVMEKGYKMWDWNIDSKDWFFRDKRLVANTIGQIAAHSKKEPVVILLHEREETLAQLPELLTYLEKEKYRFEALDETMAPVHLK
nr:polysaccharide deacetylase family protein [Bacillus sp. REN3]